MICGAIAAVVVGDASTLRNRVIARAIVIGVGFQ